VTASVYLFWAMTSRVMIRRAGPRHEPEGRAVIWHDPGEVERLDLRAGPAGPDGAPAPPFKFLEEGPGSTSPKVEVEDARGRKWQLKFGGEVRSEPFATRLAWAAGYFVEPSYFVPGGTIERVPELEYAADFVHPDGSFEPARFELKPKDVDKVDDEHSWAWDSNPFVGTRELAGLKVVMMLTSNWDDKDVRDVSRGSNTAILEVDIEDAEDEARYIVSDWGGSMGRWGAVVSRSKWDCAGYEEQTPNFVAGVTDGLVVWGYSGQRTEDLASGVSVEDVRWIGGYLGRLTDAQLRDGLLACGATGEEVECFVRSIRARLDQLARV